MIEGSPKGGRNKARAICDECGDAVTVACGYHRNSNGNWFPDEGQAKTKLRAHKWAVVKNKLLCPACDRKRLQGDEKMNKEDKVSPIRQPTSKQKRLIILALEDAYDDTVKRYRGGATDKTISKELGDGVMPGWVSEIREELFGPAGNEECDQLRADLLLWRKEMTDRADAMLARLDGLVTAHDKRVG
jgi:hypothetical protein